MKKQLFKFLPLIAAVFFATSCSKDDETHAPDSGKPQSGIPFSIRVNTGNSLKKLGYAESTDPNKVGYYNISFTDDDKDKLEMKIYNGVELLTTLKLTNVAACEFTGSIESEPDEDAKLTAVITTGNDQSPTYSDLSLEDLLNNCRHIFKTQNTFKYGTEEIFLTDQNTYLAISMSPCCDHKIEINKNSYTVKDGRIWVAVPSGEAVKSEGLGKELNKTPSEVLPSTINTIARQYFSVSADKKVYFSKGNLQYKPNHEEGENPWRFAEKQYDIIGYNNSKISSDTYEGFIDLFGWGTWLTGSNPTNVSTNSKDYQWDNSQTSAIGSEWEPLTSKQSVSGEWYYLCYTRKGNEFLYGEGSVAGVNGVIFLPDDWSLPDGLVFTPGISDWANNYDAETWVKMEANGAVFLPEAGVRYGTSVSNVEARGNYWSSAVQDETHARGLLFYSNKLSPSMDFYRCWGESVRLVRPL